jgi:hypothetical protein
MRALPELEIVNVRGALVWLDGTEPNEMLLADELNWALPCTGVATKGNELGPELEVPTTSPSSLIA